MARTTRKVEIVDANGVVFWAVNATGLPRSGGAVDSALRAAGLRAVVANAPVGPSRFAINYSDLDPTASIDAAREHHDKRATQVSSLLMLLLSRPGHWFTREDVRKVAGDSGDRRFREIRDANWPVESRPGENRTHEVRINFPDNTPRSRRCSDNEGPTHHD